jgi:hypothetical protein
VCVCVCVYNREEDDRIGSNEIFLSSSWTRYGVRRDSTGLRHGTDAKETHSYDDVDQVSVVAFGLSCLKFHVSTVRGIWNTR